MKGARSIRVYPDGMRLLYQLGATACSGRRVAQSCDQGILRSVKACSCINSGFTAKTQSSQRNSSVKIN